MMKLQILVLYNRIALTLAKNLQRYREKKVYVLFFIFDLVVTLTLTIAAFAILNMALYRIEPNNYAMLSTPDWFAFLFYSFNTAISNQIPDIVAVSNFAKLLLMSEVAIFSILALTIIGSIILNVKTERYDRELNTLITTLTNEGKHFEKRVKNELRFSDINDGIKLIEEAKSWSLRAVLWLTKQIS